jgi:putative polyhydroxyalkanoate system protein
MSDLKVFREHQLGLERARKVAKDWAGYAEKKLDMTCTFHTGATEDRVEFTRSGVKGELKVTADRFELEAKLGLLLKAFAGQIQTETSRKLDEALAKEAQRGA